MHSLPIPQPPWTKAEKRLESSCRKALLTFNMLEEAESVAVALSGGKDSLSLLFLLHAISGRGFPPFKLHAIHVSGEFSCGAGVNSSYLQAICSELGVDLIVKESTQTLDRLECYSCSRERRSLLFDAAKEAGASTVAFGHHRDDNAQTLMMNLLHKGEFAGMLPKISMHAYGIAIIRPLIFIPEKSLEAFAKERGFARITCRCPVGQRSMRKEVNSMLHELEALFPHARKNLSEAALRYGSDKAARPLALKRSYDTI